MNMKKSGANRPVACVVIVAFVLLTANPGLVAEDGKKGGDEDGPTFRVKRGDQEIPSDVKERFDRIFKEGVDLHNDMEYDRAIQKFNEAKKFALTPKQKADLYFYLSLALYITIEGRDRKEFENALENVVIFDYHRELDEQLCPTSYIEIFKGLKADYGAIRILSKPMGADVFVNKSQEPVGKTPLTVGARAGSVRIQVKRDKKSKESVLKVVAGQEIEPPIYNLSGKFPLALLLGGAAAAVGGVVAVLALGGGEGVNASVSDTGSIQVNSSPSGANIFLDGKDTGKLTNSILSDISVGSHTVKLVKEGYVDYQESVTVAKDQTVSLNITLSKLTITISSPTSGALWTRGWDKEIRWQTGESASAKITGDCTHSPQSLARSMKNYSSLIRLQREPQAALRNQGIRESRRGRAIETINGGFSSQTQNAEIINGAERMGIGSIRNGSKSLRPGDQKFPSFRPQFLPSPQPDQRMDLSSRLDIQAIENVIIDLYKGGSKIQNIAPKIPNQSDNSFAWTVEPSLASGTDYKIRVSYYENDSVYDESDPFEISDFFEEDFAGDTNVKKFWTVNPADTSGFWSVEGDSYIELGGGTGVQTISFYSKTLYSNFRAGINCSAGTTSPAPEYGIAVSESQSTSGNFFIVFIDPVNQTYRVKVRIAGSSAYDLIPSTFSSHIRAGTAENRMEVKKLGSNVDLYFNDVFIRSFSPPWSQAGYIGLATQTNFKVKFNSISVKSSA